MLSGFLGGCMNTFSLVQALTVALPEDINRLKEAGMLSDALHLIDKRLNTDIPEMLRNRLVCERERIRRLPLQYPYDHSKALSLMQEAVPSFSEDDLARFEEQGLVDWIYINGEKRYFVRFHRSLLKYCGNPIKDNHFLDEMIRKIKTDGILAKRITIDASIAPEQDSFVTGRYRAWLPIPLECDQQYDLQILAGNPDRIGQKDSLARCAYWERELEKCYPFRILYSYTNAIRYADPLSDSRGCRRIYPEIREPDCSDLEEDGVQIRFTPYLKALAHEITANSRTALEKAWSIYLFCTQKVRYTFMRQYFQIDNIGEYCALNLRGDCGLQAVLFIILCRIANIPARWQSGLCITDNDVGCHDWAQFYLEHWGWLFADPSFGGSAWRSGNTERHRFYFGNIDPARMAACRCFMAPVDPDNDQLRLDPYDLQTGEIERIGALYPLMGAQIRSEQRLISMKDIDV